MGLDITAYRKITTAPAEWWNEEEGDIAEDHWDEAVRLWANPDFPGREEGISPSAILHTYEDSMGFRAGSYGGYNSWREWLAELAGYPEFTYDGDWRGTITSRAASCYVGGATGPFSELINFSDCEGVIGPVVSKKLLQDFKDFEEKAKASCEPGPHGSYNYDKYKEWMTAFEFGADDGAVSFH